MNTSEYNEVKGDDCTNHKSRRNWKPFLRQLFVCSGVWASFFVNGMVTGAPTVFIPQIRRENNSTAAVSDAMASWLPSVMSFSGIPCVIVLSIFSRFIGRKICFLIICINTFVSLLVFYTSSSVYQILISQIMQGLLRASQTVTSLAILTEFTSPEYRGLLMSIKSGTFYWGVWTSNAIGTFYHWKMIGLVNILCVAYMFTTVLMWPESPYWLASKGKYEEASANHHWLKGYDEKSEKELSRLISTQKEYVKINKNIKRTRIEIIRDVYTTMMSVEFYKPLVIATLTGSLVIFSGKLVITVYAIDIIKKITANESTAYAGMLILDGITVFSMYVGSIISKFAKRRTLLLGCASIEVMFLFSMSLYFYLINLSVIRENKYISVGLLMLFSIAVSCGPLILCSTVIGEMIPLRSRNLAFCTIALTEKFEVGLALKMAPYLFKGFGVHGMFLFFGISSSILIALLYKYLPETKNKTLQEISDSIQGAKNSERVQETNHLMKNSDVGAAVA